MENQESAKQTQPGNGKEQPKRELAPLRFWAQGEVVVVGPRDDINQVATRVENELKIALKPKLESNPESKPPRTTIWSLIRLLVRLIVDFILLLFSGRKRAGNENREGATTPHPEQDDGNPRPGSEAAGAQNLDVPVDLALVETVTYKILPSDRAEQAPSAPDVVAKFKELSDGLAVAANPNYKTGRAVLEFSGDPDSSEGASLTDAGGVEIKPAEAEASFFNQWALHARKEGRVGIGLFKSKFVTEELSSEDELIEKRSVAHAGGGITVAVFDASPFDQASRWRNVGIDPTPPWDRNRKIRSLKHTPVPGVPDARDHGVFSASLVQVVAPQSDIRLVRVLNDSNRGKLDVLNEELLIFIDDQVRNNAASREKPLAKTVINLSLGVHVGPQESANGSDDPAETLHMILKEAHRLGAVIVAAAGNDSAGSQIPASYNFVIGVGASNCDGGQGCFSNSGDVYAPGGDHAKRCEPSMSDCTVENEFKHCIIGYSHHISPDSHYASWKGTSFAAPLVSGQAALLLGAGCDQNEVRSRIVGTATPVAVANAVSIIDIPESFKGLP